MVGPDDTKDRILQSTDIVRLIGEQLALSKKGKEWVGLCPFHDDSKPSLSISPTKQIFKCFSCGAGGDVFTFVMKYHKMTFPETLQYLGERLGIEVRTHHRSGVQGEPLDLRRQIAQANTHALAFFGSALTDAKQGQIARDYVIQRGIQPETARQFQLGYAPDQWDALVQTIQEQKWDHSSFEAAGLIGRRENAATYLDRFRHRLVFPIFDALGRPIAFGGRILPSSDRSDRVNAKYLNSPETPLFNKSATLYGLDLAQKSMIQCRTALIVEGYLDVIACHQAGVRNVVATLGTALTREHVIQLRRFVDKVVLVFDGDEAGQRAADRAVELFLTESVDVSIAVLPRNLEAPTDPAELLTRKDGVAMWQKSIDTAQDAISYQFQRLQLQLDAADSVTGRQKVVETYLSRLAQMGLLRTGELRQALVIQRLADLLKINQATIANLVQKLMPIEQHKTPPRSGEEAIEDASALNHSRSTPPRIDLAERQLIGCLTQCNSLFEQPLHDGRSFAKAITPNLITGSSSRRIYQHVYDRLQQQLPLTLAWLSSELAAADDLALVELATAADAVADQASRGQPNHVTQILVAAAEAILDHHHQCDYKLQRQAVLQERDQKLADRANRLCEPLKKPSPIRILRVAE